MEELTEATENCKISNFLNCARHVTLREKRNE